MLKQKFNSSEILTNIKTIARQNPSRTLIELVNNSVKIQGVLKDGEYKIVAFHKQPNEKRIGIVRCALFFLLKYLINKNFNIQTVKISSPTPGDGNMERLIGMYNDMGFYKASDIQGDNDLTSSVDKLIEELSKQCEGYVGGTPSTYSYKSTKRKATRRKKKKHKYNKRKTIRRMSKKSISNRRKNTRRRRR